MPAGMGLWYQNSALHEILDMLRAVNCELCTPLILLQSRHVGGKASETVLPSHCQSCRLRCLRFCYRTRPSVLEDGFNPAKGKLSSPLRIGSTRSQFGGVLRSAADQRFNMSTRVTSRGSALALLHSG